MLARFLKPVYAHCDVPCGIYETDTMAHAAATCLRMAEKIEALGDIDDTDKHNNFVRMVQTKEQHARLVKDQLAMLWMDYFKPEHLEAHPQLHDLVWRTGKQASVVKQQVSSEACQKLIELVADIANVFAETKKP